MPKRSEASSITVDGRRIQRARDLVFGIAGGRSLEEVRLDVTERDEFGQLETVLNAFAVEFSQAKAEARRYEEERGKLIEAQRKEIALLSTPIIQVSDGILAIPMVGRLDAQRAEEVVLRVAESIRGSGDRRVVIDVTGLLEVDAATADALKRLVNVLRLLGVKCVVTGISGVIARSMIEHGIDLGVITLATLKDGLHALRR